VNERGIETNPGWIIEINLEKDAGYRAAKQIFSEKAKPDFVFAANDLIAQGIYLALKELRLQIPEDVGIIGFGNLEISEILDPPLTTIHIPTADIVEEAIDL